MSPSVFNIDYGLYGISQKGQRGGSLMYNERVTEIVKAGHRHGRGTAEGPQIK